MALIYIKRPPEKICVNKRRHWRLSHYWAENGRLLMSLPTKLQLFPDMFKVAFLVRDDRVLKVPLGCLLRLFAPLTPLTRSAALRFAMLALLAHSVHELVHSLRSLPCGAVEILQYVFML